MAGSPLSVRSLGAARPSFGPEWRWRCWRRGTRWSRSSPSWERLSDFNPKVTPFAQAWNDYRSVTGNVAAASMYEMVFDEDDVDARDLDSPEGLIEELETQAALLISPTDERGPA
jgi:hypothetical protein